MNSTGKRGPSRRAARLVRAQVRMGQTMAARLDLLAHTHNVTRSEMVRRLLARALGEN